MNSTGQNICWSLPQNGLTLGIQCGDGFVSLLLKNVGQTPLQVLSHVLSGEVHLDWFRIRLTARGKDHTIRLSEARDRSPRITRTLAPGESLMHRVDVVSWAKRRANQCVIFEPGEVALWASYRVQNEKTVWNGDLEAGPAGWIIPIDGLSK